MFALAIDRAFDVGVLAHRGGEEEVDKFFAGIAADDADVEKAIVGAGVDEDGEAGAILAEIADEGESAGFGEDFVSVNLYGEWGGFVLEEGDAEGSM